MTASPVVLLTALTTGSDRLLVIPLDLAKREVGTAAVLAHGVTFGEVRRNPDAAAVVERHLPTYRRWLEEEGELDESEASAWVPDDEQPFDALEFFGEEDFDAWNPDPLQSTARWCQEHLPDLWQRLSQADSGWGFDYVPPAGFPLEVRNEVEHELERRGYQVRRANRLHDLYLNPSQEAVDVLSLCDQ